MSRPSLSVSDDAPPDPPGKAEGPKESGAGAEPGGLGEPGGFGFRLVVAPAAGRLRHLPPVRFHEGDEWVAAGQAVAFVEQGNVSVRVESPVEARVAGVLVRDGEPVFRGQPIVWLEEPPLRPGRADR